MLSYSHNLRDNIIRWFQYGVICREIHCEHLVTHYFTLYVKSVAKWLFVRPNRSTVHRFYGLDAPVGVQIGEIWGLHWPKDPVLFHSVWTCLLTAVGVVRT